MASARRSCQYPAGPVKVTRRPHPAAGPGWQLELALRADQVGRLSPQVVCRRAVGDRVVRIGNGIVRVQSRFGRDGYAGSTRQSLASFTSTSRPMIESSRLS